MIKYYTVKQIRNNNDVAVYTPDEGLMKGNMFKNEYIPYKNYKPSMINSQTNQGQLLDELMAYYLAMHDLNLYLDVHPEDEQMIALFISYREEYNNIMKDYENKYGPLNLEAGSLDSGTWKWIDKPWPWGEKNV